MTIPIKKLNNGFELPVLGLGTWKMTQADAPVIRAAIERGVTHIDTAEVYGDGDSEEAVAEAIQGFDRSKLTLVSKVNPRNLDPDTAKDRFKLSLKRLKVDYLDLYLLHRYPHDTGLEQPLNDLNELVDQGVLRHIGVSNFNTVQLAEAQKLSKHPVVMNQVHYSLRVREVEHRDVLRYCQRNDTFLNAWRPLEAGAFTKDIPILRGLSEKYDKTPLQIALNWLFALENVVTIPKSSKFEHLEENLGALGWELEVEDVERLSREYPDQLTVSDLLPLNSQ